MFAHSSIESVTTPIIAAYVDEMQKEKMRSIDESIARYENFDAEFMKYMSEVTEEYE